MLRSLATTWQHLRRGIALSISMAILLVTEQAGAQGSPPTHIGQALLVGIENYTNLPPLELVVANDLRLMRETLLRVGYDPDAVRVLTNATSLQGEIWADYEQRLGKSEIEGAVSDLKPGYEVTLLYLSGHGATYGHKRHMAMHDSAPQRGNSYLSINQLSKYLHDNLQGAHKVLIVDACSTDALTNGDELNVAEEWATQQIFSSRVGQKSEPLPDKYSLFTKLLSQVLLNPRGAGDTELTVEQAFVDLEERMSLYWTAVNGNVKTLSCQKLPVGSAPAAGSNPFSIQLPKQCPGKVFFGSSANVLARREPSLCERLARGNQEPIETFINRQRQCLATSRRQ